MTQQTKTLEELRGEVQNWQNLYGTSLGKANTLINDLLAALEQAQKANEWRDKVLKNSDKVI